MSYQIFQKLLTLLAFSTALISCAQSTSFAEEAPKLAPEFLSADSVWVDQVLASLSMEEQIAQLLMVPI
ncbi:MAG: hypothetical protein QMC37_09695, partial [Flavobacteriales bacterium]